MPPQREGRASRRREPGAARREGAVFPPTPVNVAYMTELETAAQRAMRKTVTPQAALEQVQRRLRVYMEPYRGL